MYTYYNGNRNNPTTGLGKNELRVTGEGRISVQPNQADIVVGVSTESTDLVTAQAENAAISEKVISTLVEIPLTREQIRTSDYSIFPQYDYKDGIQTFRNYRVDHRLTITTSNVEQAGIIVDTAVKSGANSVNGVTFSISNRTTYEQQALSLAVQHATYKALTLAKSIQVQLLHPPVMIIEGGSMSQPEPLLLASSPFVKSASTTTLEPGLLEVTASITAVFTY